MGTMLAVKARILLTMTTLGELKINHKILAVRPRFSAGQDTQISFG